MLSFLAFVLSSPSHARKTITSSSAAGSACRISCFPTPKTPNQVKYHQYLQNKGLPVVIGLGPAGTGKSLFACSQALSALHAGDVDKIVLTRPAISANEDLGYLPGGLFNKMEPYMRPILDVCEELYRPSEVAGLLKTGKIEICPLGFMRGRTFKNAFLVADEMQNASIEQTFLLLTRLGDNSRLVITGDLAQSDLKSYPKNIMNGLTDLVQRLHLHGCPSTMAMIELEAVDVQRSIAVAEALALYAHKNSETNLLGRYPLML
jgi:phosphate starvation-inducible PhoH-like protein